MSRLAPWNQITRQYAGKAPLLSWSRRPDHHNYAQSQANLVEYDINQSNHQTIPHALILLIPPPSLSPQRQSIHHLHPKSKAIRDIKCSYQTDCIQCSLITLKWLNQSPGLPSTLVSPLRVVSVTTYTRQEEAQRLRRRNSKVRYTY